MQRYHELFNYKSAFRILSKGRVVLAISAFFSGTTLLFAAPTGGVVTTGNASITSGSSTTTITQTTNKASINWQSFNIAPSETVNFVQPSSSSITLNRVVGTSNSLIEGALNANGQVFLINPNGVIFGKGAQVNVGGIVASTLNISDTDFQAGNYKFSGESSAQVLNMGTINVAKGGYAVLAGKSVENDGLIAATLGNVQLTGASAMTLNLNGNSLVNLTIDKGTLDALVANKGIIKADGGIVYLTTKALDTVLNGMVNNTGLIEANSLDMQNGKIVLYAHGGTTNVNGTLSATNGSLETSGNVLHVSDTTNIKAKSWLLDPTDITIESTGGTDLAGSSISASTIDTVLNGGTDVTLTATNDINVNQAMAWNQHVLTLSAGNNININAQMDLTNTAGLSLLYAQTNGAGTYNIHAPINIATTGSFSTQHATDPLINYTIIDALGNVGDDQTIGVNSLQALASVANLAGNYVLGANIDASSTSTWNSGAGFTPIGNGSTNFTGTFDGLGHTISNLTINRPSTDYVGLFGYVGHGSIQNVGLINATITGSNYVGGLVGESSYSTITNSYAMGSVSGTSRVGGLVGLNNWASTSNSYATGSVSGTSYVGGLVGSNNSAISNSYATGNVSGTSYVGGLAGYNYVTTISDSYATGNVSGTGNHVGGLVGRSDWGSFTNSYATGSVSGNNNVGGLVGDNNGAIITNSYATGSVHGNNYVGGLVGYNTNTTISNSYATGSVSGNSNVGGLVGSNYSATISNSYWDIDSTGQANAVGTYIGTTTNLIGIHSSGSVNAYNLSTYSNFDIANMSDTSNTTSTWVIIDGYTRPFLRSEYSTTIANDHQLQLMAMNLGASYTLASNIDATATGTAGSGMWATTGFVPIGNSSSYFSGTFDGLGHTITGLTINRSSIDYVGLFGYTGGTIKNVGLVGGSVSGHDEVGGLIGYNGGGIITNSYATGSVSGNAVVGGLIGFNNGNGTTITNSYATGNVIGTGSDVGGLVGYNYGGTITNTYATGNVSGSTAVGGLVGLNQYYGNIIKSYATGSVSGSQYVGGLVGYSYYGNITNSFWNIQTSGQANGVGLNTGGSANVTEKTTAQMQDIATYSAWGSDIVIDPSLGLTSYPQLRVLTSGLNAGTSVWVIGGVVLSYNLSTISSGYTYSGLSQSLSSLWSASDIFGSTYSSWIAGTDYSFIYGGNTVTGFTNAGTYSNISIDILKSGYIVPSTGNTNGGFTISKANATVTANSDTTKVYNGTSQSVSGFTATGLVNSETTSVLTGVSGATATGTNAGTYNTALAGTDTNYNLTFVNGSLGIAKANATVTANSDTSKVYNGTSQSVSGFTATGLVNSETTSVLTGVTGATATGTNAGTYNTALAGTDTNYNLTFVNGTLGIAKANATVTANSDTSKVYTGVAQSVSGFTATGLVNNEQSTVLTGVTGATATGTNAGTYNTALAGTDTNYNLTFVDGSLGIAKANATVTANSDTTKVYNGTSQSVSGFTATGLVNNEQSTVLTGVTGATATGTNAGTYNTALAGTDANYILAFVNGSLGIAKANATVTANSDTSKVYNGTAQSVSGFTATGLVNSETTSVLINVSATGASGINAGTYTSTASGTDANYNLTFVDGTLQINKAAISAVSGISASNKVYDGTTDATLTTSGAAFTGKVNGDNLTVATATGAFTDKNVGNGKTVNISGITLGGTSAGNYTLSDATATTTANITPSAQTNNILTPIANQIVTHHETALMENPNIIEHIAFNPDNGVLVGSTFVSLQNGGMHLPTGIDQWNGSFNNQEEGK